MGGSGGTTTSGSGFFSAGLCVPRYQPSERGTRPAVVQWRPLLEQYDWDVDTALRIVDCESGGDPAAVNRWSGAAVGSATADSTASELINASTMFRATSSRNCTGGLFMK